MADDPEIPDPSLRARFELHARYAGGEGWSGAVRPRAGGPLQLLKILQPGCQVAEASLLASLAHPAIPAVLEIGTTEDRRSYLLREHFAGTPLAELLPLSVEAVTELAGALLQVLGYVHLRGVLHLDLKPANVLRRDDGTGYALLDFGLGSRVWETAAGGTPLYAAPEMVLGLEPDARTDLYSLGVVLLVALRGPRAHDLMRWRRHFPGRDLLTALQVDVDDLPAPFDTLLVRLLALQPGQRFADAQEALEALWRRSGRPSVDLLRPDPIRAFAAELERAIDRAGDGSLRIEGGDAADRRALALHAGCQLVDRRIESDATSVVLRTERGGVVTFAVPALTATQLARHLGDVLGLDFESAAAAADSLIAAGATTPAAVWQQLQTLVEGGSIQPDGTRWIWPDALAGRNGQPALPEPATTPGALRATAARGGLEAALASYRRLLPGLEGAAERELRAALAEGLVQAGEPSHAAALVHDLPVLAARVLLDLGRVEAAEQRLDQAENGDAEPHPDAVLLRANIAYARGDLEAAEQLVLALMQRRDALPDQVLLGLLLTRRGRVEEAVELLQQVTRELEQLDHPFLLAAALTNLAEAERAAGRTERARHHHQRALALYRRLGHVRYTAMAANNLGVLAKDCGDAGEAREHLRRARSLFRHVGDDLGAALAEANLGIVALRSGDPDLALGRLRRALGELERLGAGQARPLVQVMMAQAHARRGERDLAEACLRAAGPPQSERLKTEAEVARQLLEATPPEPAGARDAARAAPRAAADSSALASGVVRTLLGLNRRLATEADLEQVMRLVLDAAVSLAGGRSGYLLIARPGGLRSEVRIGPTSDAAVAFSRSLVNRAMQRRQVLTDDEARRDRELMEMPSVRDLGARSAICVPFVTASGVEGALYVEHPGRAGAFGMDAKELLDVLADQAAIAVERLLHEERMLADVEHSKRALRAANQALRSPRTPKMLGDSAPIRALRVEIGKLADADLPVLVLGETGTGKELAASAIHEGSRRRKNAFVAVSCAAIPEGLLESELFGHQRGAFTGADGDRAGLLELASGGTLFLDEIGDMPLALQAKLLRALQDGAIRPLGGQRPIAVDLRVISATHRDLRAMVDDGTFRADLYYRLAAAELLVPALRERGDDVVLLARAFLEQLGRKHRRPLGLGAGAVAALRRYSWPGNVRELEHAVTRAFLLSEGRELDPAQLPVARPRRPAEPSDDEIITLAEAEARAVRTALRACGGDKSKAAKVLGISRSALYDKLRRMDERGR